MATNTSPSVRDSKQDRRRSRDERGIASAATSARSADRLPSPPRERRPMLAALAVLLIVGGAAAAGLLALRADDRVPVLVASRDIAAGDEITVEALTSTSVASEGTLLIPVSDSALLAGQYARVAISDGQLLDTAMLTDTAPLQPGSVAVGAALAAGRLPASGLRPGDIVQLIRVGEGAGSVLVDDALVSSFYSQAEGTVDGTAGSTATFIVDERDGAEVAAIAAAGNLSAVLVTRGAAPDEDR